MIKRLFRQMLLTQIVSAMTVVLCMLIDSIMIGRFLGVAAMTAYGLAMPVLLIFAAFGSMLAAGVQVMCGRTMGSGSQKGTHSCFTASVLLAGGVSVAGTLLILLFTDPVCTLLGAGRAAPDNEVFYLTRNYIRGFVIGAPVFILSQIMVPYMQLSGKRKRLVAAVAVMTVGDILFDAANVFLIKWGIFGMGFASSLSYYAAFAVGVVYFFRKDCIFKLKPKLFSLKTCAKLLKNGIPTLINQISLVLLTFTLNKLLLVVGGNLSVAAYSVISTVGNICYSFSSGIAAVVLTLSSIFYSDTDGVSLRQLIRTMCYYALVVCAAVTVAITVFARPLVSLFTENADATALAAKGLRLFVLSLVPCAFNTCFKNYYQGIAHVKLTMCISVCQNFLLTAFAAIVLGSIWGVNGIWCGFAAGETLTFLVMTAFICYRRKKVAFSVHAYSLLPEQFGVRESDCFECSATTREEIHFASQEAKQFCLEKNLSRKLSTMIALCIEEMGNSILEHGFVEGQSNIIDFRVVLQEDSSFLRIRDNCKRFDPVRYLEMHNEDDSDSHIGIRMTMQLVKDAYYVNSLGLNNLTLML